MRQNVSSGHLDWTSGDGQARLIEPEQKQSFSEAKLNGRTSEISLRLTCWCDSFFLIYTVIVLHCHCMKRVFSGFFNVNYSLVLKDFRRNQVKKKNLRVCLLKSLIVWVFFAQQAKKRVPTKYSNGKIIVGWKMNACQRGTVCFMLK